jgi:hypothetical protein
MNSFLIYSRGPEKNAIPKIRKIMENVKHITKVAGVRIIVANVKKHPIIINAAKANEMNAY